MDDQHNVRMFQQLLDNCYSSHGWAIPSHITHYQARILAQMIDQPQWRPEPSYAERYFQIRTPSEAIELGDVCWFTRAVFPELGTGRGITPTYYAQLGASCYERALKYSQLPTIAVLARHFEFLAEAAYTAVRLNGEFRSMWD